MVNENGEQLGVMPVQQALQLARESGLDLVEVAATAKPPVCRVLNYGKYRYEQIKKERQARRSQRSGTLKEVRLRPAIGGHDLAIKMKTARKLLEGGNKVRLFVIFRMRELSHPELGWNVLRQLAEGLKDVAVPDGTPSVEQRRMSLTLLPATPAKSGSTEKDAKAKNPQGS